MISRRQLVARSSNRRANWELHGGAEDLEVVGEARRQDALWSLCGGSRGDRVRHDVIAVLIPEPDNPHDANAISVRIDGWLVGYLPRQVAARYVPGLRRLMSRSGAQSWFGSLPTADRPAIAMLRELLAAERDPIDRHFQFAELEARLYRARDLYDTALSEFDAACRQHDAEMDTIRAAFIAKWGKVPLLETYRRMAVRQQKRKDWTACLWWSERGLALYGSEAAREDAVEDLLKRRDRALSKLDEQAGPGRTGPATRDRR